MKVLPSFIRLSALALSLLLAVGAAASPTPLSAAVSGDLNGDGVFDVADAFYLIDYLFARGSAPAASGDVNGDGHVDVSDVFYMINALFAGGARPKDTNRPQILETRPGFGDNQDVPLNARFAVLFDEPMDAASLTTATFWIEDGAHHRVPGAVTVSDDRRIATFTPASLLPALVTFSFGFDLAAIKDAAGNPVAWDGGMIRSATTGLTVDATPPGVIDANPPLGFVVPRNVALHVDFEEPVQRFDLARRFTLTGDTAVPVRPSLSQDGRSVTLLLDAPLAAGRTYTLTARAVFDKAGNESALFTRTFTTDDTLDMTPPTPTWNVGENAVVGTTTAFRLGSDEPLDTLRFDPFSLGISGYGYARVPASVTWSADRRLVTLTPSAPLTPRATYTLTAYAWDLSGHEGYAVVPFTVGDAADTTAPRVLRVSPPDGAQNVARNARLEVVLSEPIDPLSVASGALATSPPAGGTPRLDTSRTRLSLEGASLAAATTYTLTLGVVRDAAGNPAVPFSSTFRTSSVVADTTGPQLVGITPASNAVGVSRASPIAVTYSEAIAPTSVAAPGFRVTVGTTPSFPGTLSVSGGTVTFTPSFPFPPGARVEAYVGEPPMTDLSGNEAPGAYTSFTTALDADPSSPTVVSVFPPNGATGVPSTPTVFSLRFSEPVKVVDQTSALAIYANGELMRIFPALSPDGLETSGSFLLPGGPALVTIVTGDGFRDLSGNVLAPFSSSFTTVGAPSDARPEILGVRPANGAGHVAATTPVVLFSSVALDPASVADGVFVLEEGLPHAGSVTLSADGRTITYQPATPFAAGADVTVIVTGIRSVSGVSPYWGFQSSFRVGAAAGLSVLAVSPTWYPVPPNARFALRYDAPLDPATVSPATVRLSRGATPLAATVELLDGARRILLTPAAPLPPDADVSFLVSGVKGVDGTPAPSHSSVHRGNLPVDSAPSSVTGVSPVNGATGVPLNAVVSASVSEPLDLTVADAPLRLTRNGVAVPTVGSGPMTLTPLTLLEPGAAYEVHVDPLVDVAGNVGPSFVSSFVAGAAPDVDRPRVVSVDPTGFDVPVNATIRVRFDEPVAPTSVSSALQVEEEPYFGYVSGTTSVTGDGREVVLVPDAPLAAGGRYTISCLGVRDLVGNEMQSLYPVTFSVSFTPDTTPPHVVGVSPVNGTTSVPTNAVVMVAFDEAISGERLEERFTITGPGGPVPFRATLEEGNRRVRLQPQSPLGAGATYALAIGAVADRAGNVLAPVAPVSFTTGTTPDLSAPSVVGMSPPPGTVANAAPLLSIAYAERVNVLTASATLTDDDGRREVAGAVVAGAGGTSVVFVPERPLDPMRPYRLTWGTIEDLAGNRSNDNGFIDFVPGSGSDAVGPSVKSVSPPNGATGVPSNAEVSVRFDEPISPVSLTAFTLTGPQGAVAGAVTLSAEGTRATLVPRTRLAASATYTIQVSGVRDLAGNGGGGFSAAFTTRATSDVDLLEPSLLAIQPTNGAAGVSPTSTVTFDFSEAVDPTSVSSATLPVRAGMMWSGEAWPGTYTVLGEIVRFKPSLPFPPGATVWVSGDGVGVTDLAGNPLDRSFFFSFTIGAGTDTTPPALVSISPPDGATNVPFGAPVVLRFSEPLDRGTVERAFVAFGEYWSTTELSDDGMTCTLHVSAEPGTTVAVLGTGLAKDVAGNPLPSFATHYTVESLPHAEPLQIRRVVPDWTGIPDGTHVVLTTDQPLDPATLEAGLIVTVDGVPVAGTRVLFAGGRILEFTPAAPFPPGARVAVFLTPALRSVGGAARALGQVDEFTIPKTRPAHLVAANPNAYAQSIPTNARIRLLYSAPLDAATVASAVSLTRTGAVAATASLDAGARLLTITPSAPLLPSSAYRLVVDGLRDVDGSAVERLDVFVLTQAGPDTVPPQVVLLEPANGAAGVGINAAVTLKLSEAIDRTSVTSATVRARQNGNALAPALVRLSDDARTISLEPQRPLVPGVPVTFEANGLLDLAGNPLPAVTSTFTPGSEADFGFFGPREVSPWGAALPTNGTVRLAFDEPIDGATLDAQSVRLHLYGDATPVPVSIELSPDRRLLTVRPSSPLAPWEFYELEIDELYDASGNADYDRFSHTFTTTDGPDTAAPQLQRASPTSGLAGVPLNAPITLSFSEPPSSFRLADVIHLTAGGQPIPFSFGIEGNVLRVFPRGVLPPNATIGLSVDGVTDVAGNVAAPYAATFATSGVLDFVRPYVNAFSPAEGAKNVSRTPTVSVTFSERVDPTTVTPLSFFLLPSAPANVTVSPDGLHATLVPAQPLAPYTSYQFFTGASITDLAGNGIFMYRIGGFTTGP